MSTRAMYSFIDEQTTVHVYKHHDGYPEGAASWITNALPHAWPLPRFEADDFGAAFVAANKPAGGGGVCLVPGASEEDRRRSACDIEYRYEIRAKGGKLHVTAYGTSFNWRGGGDAGAASSWTEKRIFAGSLAAMVKKFGAPFVGQAA